MTSQQEKSAFGRYLPFWLAIRPRLHPRVLFHYLYLDSVIFFFINIPLHIKQTTLGQLNGTPFMMSLKRSNSPSNTALNVVTNHLEGLEIKELRHRNAKLESDLAALKEQTGRHMERYGDLVWAT